MKKTIERTLLILGVFIGAILVAQNYCYADSQEGKVSFEVDLILSTVDDVSIEKINPVDESKLTKIYNAADRLIYETTDSNDKKLEQLINKSDYLTEISNTIYYKLSR